MIGALSLTSNVVGKKVVMAGTGLILYGYLVLHMVGNLKIFGGAAKLNGYAIWLREAFGPVFGHEQLLWSVRVILALALVGHVVVAVQLSSLDLASRPIQYRKRRNLAHGWAAPTMRWGGLALGLFVVYHLLHLTTGDLHRDFRGHEQAYSNVVVAFRQPLETAVYAFAMLALGLHLYHGVWSFAQTLGLRSRDNDAFWRGLAWASAILIAGGFVVVPLSVMLTIIR